MTPRKKSLNILKYFDHINDESVKCKTCQRVIKTGRTFNLKKHLFQVHKVSVENDQNSAPIKTIKHQTIKVKMCKKKLIRSYIGLVTEDCVSFNVLNSENMRNIIDPICQGLTEKYGKPFSLNGNKCKSVLKLVAENIRLGLTQEMKNRLISLKIDSATRLNRNIFGISAQFISTNEIHSRILGMTELKGVGASTSKNLAKEIVSVLEKYNINLSQVVSVTSDNGPNMLKASKILSQQCNSEDDCLEGNVDYIKQIDIFETFDDARLGDLAICRCAAHTAQLCALDVTKNADIKNYILQCRNMTKYILKTSTGFRDIFELKQFKLPQLDCPTRWGSTYEMIERLYKAKELLSNIEPVANKSHDENFDSNTSYWEFIESYTTIMKTLQTTIIKFQEEQLHYGDFYAIWLTCKLTTAQMYESISDNPSGIGFKIAKSLIESIQSRTKKLMKNTGVISCLYMDPRFQHMLTDSQKRDAANYLKTLWQKIKAQNPNLLESSEQNIIETAYGRENNYFEILDSFLSAKITPQNISIDIYLKIETLKLPCMKASLNVLNYWKERQLSDPELYELSKVCFAIPPTQVTVERAFSLLKLVLADNRSRLSRETLENILMVKLNPSHLKYAIENLNLFQDDEDS